MKKISILLIGVMCLGTTFVMARPANKITNTRILQAAKDTTVIYAGVKIFIPAVQTVILGQASDGSIIMRGRNLKDVQVGAGTLSSRGPVFLAIKPENQVIRVVSGGNVLVRDGNGRTAEISAGAAVSAKDVRADIGPTLPPVTVTVAQEEVVVTRSQKPAAKPVEMDEVEYMEPVLPAFVAATSSSPASTEQAVQNVEDTLSPSTPR